MSGNVTPIRPLLPAAVNDAPAVSPVTLSPAARAFMAHIHGIQAAMDCGDMSEDEGLDRLLILQRALEASRRPRLVVDNTVRP